VTLYVDNLSETNRNFPDLPNGDRLGFTLAEIQEGIEPFVSSQLTVKQKQHLVNKKLKQVEEQIEELKMIKIALVNKLDSF
jgi:DNA-binding transcriptional MerR regulator